MPSPWECPSKEPLVPRVAPIGLEARADALEIVPPVGAADALVVGLADREADQVAGVGRGPVQLLGSLGHKNTVIWSVMTWLCSSVLVGTFPVR